MSEQSGEKHRVSPDALGEQGTDEVAGYGLYHIELLSERAAHLTLGPDTFTVFVAHRPLRLVIRHEEGPGASTDIPPTVG